MAALLLSLVIVILDQLTKQLVRLEFAVGESVPVWAGWFDLTYVRNTGAAWGMLGGQNALLAVLSVVMLVVMVCFRRAFLSDTWEHRLALGLMLGGIVGNLMDRLRLGWVTDFLDFHWRGYHWPAFNVADAAICVGVGIYVLASWWGAGHPLKEAQPPQPASAPAAGTNSGDPSG